MFIELPQQTLALRQEGHVCIRDELNEKRT